MDKGVHYANKCFFIKLYFIHCMVSCGKKTHGHFCISIDTKYTDEKCRGRDILRARSKRALVSKRSRKCRVILMVHNCWPQIAWETSDIQEFKCDIICLLKRGWTFLCMILRRITQLEWPLAHANARKLPSTFCFPQCPGKHFIYWHCHVHISQYFPFFRFFLHRCQPISIFFFCFVNSLLRFC